MRLHFCRSISIAGSEFGNNTVKACLPPTLYQWFWLMLVMNESFLLAECKAPQSLFFLHCWIQTFNLRDFFFRFLLHDFLSKLDFCNLSHFLSLYKKQNKTPKHPSMLARWVQITRLRTKRSQHDSLSSFLTYHRFNPLRLCLLLHNLLCLLGDQQLGLLALPANMLKSS